MLCRTSHAVPCCHMGQAMLCHAVPSHHCVSCCAIPCCAHRDNLGFGDRSGFACPKGSIPATRTVAIAMTEMRGVVGRKAASVTVQAGMTLTELLDYATRQSLTVPLGAVPNYKDLTIGGMLATRAHGLGPAGSSAVVSLT